jgi:hypothetical protein
MNIFMDMQAGIVWLLQDVGPDTSLFFFFSGEHCGHRKPVLACTCVHSTVRQNAIMYLVSSAPGGAAAPNISAARRSPIQDAKHCMLRFPCFMPSTPHMSRNI